MSAKIRPGNAWTAMEKLSAADVEEPRDKVEAMLSISRGETRWLPWFRRVAEKFARSTGSEFDYIAGLNRSGAANPHIIAHLEKRNAHVRCIARALPGTGSRTEKAHRIAAIVRGEENAPSAYVGGLVRDLRTKYPEHIPASDRSFERILQGLVDDETTTSNPA